MPELKQFSVFIKEARAYNVIIPAAEEIWKTRANEDIKFGPECYKIYSEGADDVMVLEDISFDNAYQVVDRHKGLNFEQSKILLNKLAKYHAASATYLQLVIIRHKKVELKIIENFILFLERKDRRRAGGNISTRN